MKLTLYCSATTMAFLSMSLVLVPVAGKLRGEASSLRDMDEKEGLSDGVLHRLLQNGTTTTAVPATTTTAVPATAAPTTVAPTTAAPSKPFPIPEPQPEPPTPAPKGKKGGGKIGKRLLDGKKGGNGGKKGDYYYDDYYYGGKGGDYYYGDYYYGKKGGKRKLGAIEEAKMEAEVDLTDGVVGVRALDKGGKSGKKGDYYYGDYYYSGKKGDYYYDDYYYTKGKKGDYYYKDYDYGDYYGGKKGGKRMLGTVENAVKEDEGDLTDGVDVRGLKDDYYGDYYYGGDYYYYGGDYYYDGDYYKGKKGDYYSDYYYGGDYYYGDYKKGKKGGKKGEGKKGGKRN